MNHADALRARVAKYEEAQRLKACKKAERELIKRRPKGLLFRKAPVFANMKYARLIEEPLRAGLSDEQYAYLAEEQLRKERIAGRKALEAKMASTFQTMKVAHTITL